MASAYLAARSLPGSDDPAWKSTGCPCGERGTSSGPATSKCGPEWLIAWIFAGSTNRGATLSPTMASSSQLSHNFNATWRNSSARWYRAAGSGWFGTPEVGRGRGIGGRHDVPAGPAAAHVVECGEPPSQTVRVVVGGGRCRDQPDVGGRPGQGRDQGDRVERVERAKLGLVLENWMVGEENRVELAALGDAGQFDVVADVGDARTRSVSGRRHAASCWPMLRRNALRCNCLAGAAIATSSFGR